MHDQKILYIDCSFGAAGDMLGAALLDLMEPSQRVACIEELNSLGVPSVKFLAESAFRAGIVGSSLRVIIDGIEEDEHLHDHTHAHAHAHIHSHSHDHSHDHGHSHGDGHHHDHSHEHAHSHLHTHDYVHDHAHVHRGLADIEAIIGGLKMSDSAKASACGIYRILAEAEGHAHGMPVSEIHFHEVGTMDAIADITAFSYLIEKLDIDRIVASPVGVGSGQVRCAHGILPVPAPATAQILSGVPMTATDLKGELCTPTGAAILKYFATEFGAMPAMTVEATGYGMGKKDFEWANCVRLMLGAAAGTEDRIIELSCNLDDMTAESIAFAMERIFAAGAVDVITTPAGMKKNRPGTVLTALCREDAREAVVEAFFKHTTTLGIREAICRRYILARDVEVLDTPYGQVRRKIANGYGVERYKYEYDDISRIARETGMTLEEVKAAIE